MTIRQRNYEGEPDTLIDVDAERISDLIKEIVHTQNESRPVVAKTFRQMGDGELLQQPIGWMNEAGELAIASELRLRADERMCRASNDREMAKRLDQCADLHIRAGKRGYNAQALREKVKRFRG